MFLSSSEITSEIDCGGIVSVPSVDAADMRPFGVRVHLSPDFLRPVASRIHLDGSGGEPCYQRCSTRSSGVLEMLPGDFVLGSTVESFKLGPDLAGFLDGRSTLARMGLFIHAGSQIIDGTSSSPRTITLELYNAGPHTLVLGESLAIGMLSFFRSSSPSDAGLVHSQYDGQFGPTAPRLGSNWRPLAESMH